MSTALELRQLHTSLAEQAGLIVQLRGSHALPAPGVMAAQAPASPDGGRAQGSEHARRVSAFAPPSVQSEHSVSAGPDALDQTSPSFSRAIVRSVRGGAAARQWNGSLAQAASEDNDGGSSQDGAEDLILM